MVKGRDGPHCKLPQNVYVYAPINVLPQFGGGGEGGLQAYTDYWQENIARVRGNLIFFYQGIPEGRDYQHPWSRWTGPVINLSSCGKWRLKEGNLLSIHAETCHPLMWSLDNVIQILIISLFCMTMCFFRSTLLLITDSLDQSSMHLPISVKADSFVVTRFLSSLSRAKKFFNNISTRFGKKNKLTHWLLHRTVRDPPQISWRFQEVFQSERKHKNKPYAQ